MNATNDNIQSIVDKATDLKHHSTKDFSDVYKGIVQLQQQDKDPAKLSADMTDLNNRLHKAGILSDMTITGIDGSNHFLAQKDGKQVAVVSNNVSDTFQQGTQKNSWLQSFENVAGEAVKGAVDEVVHHPLHVVESAAIGLAVGTAAAFVAPEVAIAAGVAGLAYGGYQLATHVPGWLADAKVVANPQNFSKNEQINANQGIEGFGAGAIDVTAGIAGGVAGGYLGSALKAGLAARAAAAATPEAETAAPSAGASDTTGTSTDTSSDGTVSHAHMQHANIANTTGQISDPSHAVNSTVPIDHSHLVGVLSSGDPSQGSESDASTTLLRAASRNENPTPIATADGSAPGRVVAEAVAKPEPAVTPSIDGTQASDATAAESAEQIAARQVQASIEQNQSIFRSAGSQDPENGIIAAQKQDYNVAFKKVIDPIKVPTLENPSGETVEPGHWIATRLNADGTPNIEKGMVNQWPVTDKTILKTYQTTPEQLSASNELVAATRTDAPPVHMVKLDQPIKIHTSWGSMEGHPNDWLVNYDFDPATGAAGNNYAIVSENSFGQTYERVGAAAAPKVGS